MGLQNLIFLVATLLPLVSSLPDEFAAMRETLIAEPMPTQFEVAMELTWKAVKDGRAPDPESMRTDGTPGTLLDALLPDSPDLGPAIETHRRRLQKASKWRFFGANIPFLSGPTLAALNASFYRYASVTPNNTVDWRKTMFITPIQAQYDCSSCWLMSAADSVAMLYGIANNHTSIPAGIQQVCDDNLTPGQPCGGLTCCDGGWPEDGYAWMVGNGNITAASNYQYWASDNRNCSLQNNYTIAGKVTGWERVAIFNQEDLKRAVNMQPVLVYISAYSPDFIAYTSGPPSNTATFKVYDGNCTSEVNHAMLVVGYNTEAPIPYWILKNTWMPDVWGDKGYMYIRMLDGPGKCGMMTVNPIYPIYFPYAPIEATVDTDSASPTTSGVNPWYQGGQWNPPGDPCKGIINPCGAGQCYVQGGIARCNCPVTTIGNQYVYGELLGVPTSKCVNLIPCTTALISPCGAGTCMNVGDGSYICGCPSGYTVGTRTNGAPTCIPVSSLGVKSKQFVTQYKDTCLGIAAKLNMTISSFVLLNPYIKCGGDNRKRLPQGLVVSLPATSTPLCTQQYAVRTIQGNSDTCSNIAWWLDNRNSEFLNMLNPPGSNPSQTLIYGTGTLAYTGTYTNFNSLLYLNPTLNCSNLLSSQQICVAGTLSGASAASITCGQTYTTVKGDSCNSISSAFNINSTYFKTLNPGINCNFNFGSFFAGVQICINATTPLNITCNQSYTVQQGDTCAQIWNAANISQFQLLYINPGLQCQPPYLYVGRQICIDSPSLTNIADPSFPTYIVKPGDTWGAVQAQFSTKCKSTSILLDKIAVQNNISDWTSFNLTSGYPLVIPCVPKIGADCGCAPSMYVCGANFVNYNSYCDARCNFAQPSTDGVCAQCTAACAGRYLLTPSPLSACPSNYICPMVSWPASLSDAMAVFTTNPICTFRQSTCQRACDIYNDKNNLAATDSTCYNRCIACHEVPCNGPALYVTNGGGLCPTCSAPGCLNGTTTRNCALNCQVWNDRWISNHMAPKVNPCTSGTILC